MRTKAGFSIGAKTMLDLDVLAFVRHEPKSRIVDRAIQAEIEKLPPEARKAFEAARTARGGGR